jgi:hypothetical protein
MGVSVETFRQVALEEDQGVWEWEHGRLLRRPRGTVLHNHQLSEFYRQVSLQLDDEQYSMRSNGGYVTLPGERYLVPDVFVLPSLYMDDFLDRPDDLEEYERRMPFIAEVWEEPTDEYDVETKFPAYKARGDLEIWRIHPREKSVIAWRRQQDGSYSESHYTGGRVPIESLPGVTIDLDRLFRY